MKKYKIDFRMEQFYLLPRSHGKTIMSLSIIQNRLATTFQEGSHSQKIGKASRYYWTGHVAPCIRLLN